MSILKKETFCYIYRAYYKHKCQSSWLLYYIFDSNKMLWLTCCYWLCMYILLWLALTSQQCEHNYREPCLSVFISPALICPVWKCMCSHAQLRGCLLPGRERKAGYFISFWKVLYFNAYANWQNLSITVLCNFLGQGINSYSETSSAAEANRICVPQSHDNF